MRTMKAWTLPQPAAIASGPLRLVEREVPSPGAGQVLIRVKACGICRTDLHIAAGELTPHRPGIVPGHQVVGVVERSSPRWSAGERVGVAWLHSTCGGCRFCRSGRENLCDHARFTGYDVDGGFAEYAVADEQFVYRIPDGFADLQAAPLLCAGIIGYRCLRLAGVAAGGRLGLYGFGAAAHVAIQIARDRGADVYVCTRDQRHQALALELDAAWAGGALAKPPVPLDAAIVFAPAGEIVPAALEAVDRAGVVVLGGIHMTDIPSFPYRLLYHERIVRSVANNTREDGVEFLAAAARIPIVTRVHEFAFEDANRALAALHGDAIQGAAVLSVA